MLILHPSCSCDGGIGIYRVVSQLGKVCGETTTMITDLDQLSNYYNAHIKKDLFVRTLGRSSFAGDKHSITQL